MLKSINSFARLASDRSEVAGACLVLLMITMMVIPLSPMMLDVLIAINIAATVVLVLSAILLDTPLSFSSFPAILLMTTLFRLSLTISTTRQILLEADAGNIVQTFGEFVVGGNVAVGLVIFLIISVVNFLVVTKGSERVAEVAARFSLDSMPGKQMSIDGDLRAGSITQEQAKAKRSALEKESQLFGAMDGAIKFVKNDAIAGLVITVINLVGGLSIGMLQLDMSFSQAGSVYSILTVGDGLVGIIPSLMTSIAAGLIVTRVTKGEADGANTAQDMIRELLGNAKALQIGGFFCLIFSFVPGMPSAVFLTAAVLMLFRSFTASKPKAKKKDADTAKQFSELIQGKAAHQLEDVMTTKTFLPLEVKIPAGLEPTTKHMLQSICKISRNQLVEHSGVLYPVFHFTDEAIEDVEFHVFGVPMLSLPVSDKRLQVFGEKEKLEELGDVLTLEYQQLSGRWCWLCDPVHLSKVQEKGLNFISFERRWSEMIDSLLVSKSKDIFTINECNMHLKRLPVDEYGEQLKEMDRVAPFAKVVEIIQKLLMERVSLKNMRLIIGAISDWAQRERDSLLISEQVRRALFEQISHQHADAKTLYVLNLDEQFEQLLRESVRSDGMGTFIDADATTLNQLVEMVMVQCREWAHMSMPPIIVCSMDCRPHFRMLIQDRLRAVPVMSYQEISSNQQLQLIGSIVFDESLLKSVQKTNMVGE